LLVGVVAEGVLDPDIGDAYREHWIRPRRDRARGLIARAVEVGELEADVDPEVLIDALFGPLYYRLLVKHAPLSLAFADSIFRSAMRGVGSTGTRAKASRAPAPRSRRR
jgi:hypothetical protein